MQKKIKQAQKYLEWEKPNQAIAELKPTLDSKQIQQEFKWVPYHMMGIALSLKGEHKASSAYLEKAVECGSEEPETFHMLSVNYYHLARFEGAEQFGREAVDRKPDFLKAWLNLGSVYRSQAKLDEALECYKKANEIDSANAGVAFRIGEIYRDQGDLNQAKKLFDITLQIEPDHIQAMLEKADIHKKKGNLDQALENLEEAREIHGDRTSIGVSEAEIYKSRGKYDDAIALYEELLEKHPESGPMRVNYALCLQEVSRFDQSEKHYRQAIEDMTDPRNAISNYLMGLHYNPNNSREYIYNEHLKLGKTFVSQQSAGRAVPSDLNPEKKLRIGFVSGGFRRHPVGWMIAGALEQLPDHDFELYCYTTNNKFDFVTRRIHQNINTWRTVVGYSADVIENIIREDELDILVDLSGHAADNCLDVMANEPAPVIAKWVGGLFNTTGLEAFDYLITDKFESPEGEEQYYTEKLVRLPDDYITYTPPAYAPFVDSVPAEENGFVTFGCFNNPTKVNEVVLRRWAKIMRQVPQSQLYLKSKQYDTASFREQIIKVLCDEDIAKERVKFEGHTSHDVHLEAYNKVDVALDPWPYSGGLTTCEALYMGVPVITLPGPTFAGRHSATHLRNVGLGQWVTNNWQEYTQKAIQLATDVDGLKEWRNSLRDQLLNSPVCDGKRLGAHLSVAFREMWRQYLEGNQEKTDDWADHITVKTQPDGEIDRLTDGPEITPLIKIKKETRDQKSTNKENHKYDMMNKSVIDTQKLAQGIELLENGNGVGEEKVEEQQYKNSDRSSTEDGRNENYSITTKDGVSICVPEDTDILSTYVLLEQDEWFEPELDFIRQFLQPGMTVIDAGAGFGVYSLPMAQKVGGEGAVYAFEPGSTAKKYLEMSKITNGFNHLEVVGRGLGKIAEEGSLEIAETPELNRIAEGGKETVCVTTLNAWWEFAGKPEIDFLKLDVNGMEADVLAGGSWIFEKEEPVILAAIDKNEGNFKLLKEQFESYNYQLFKYIPVLGLLDRFDPEVGADPFQMNVIAIAESRIQRFKDNGWIFEKVIENAARDTNEWKEVLEKTSWAKTQITNWEKNISGGDHDEYLQALNLVCAAEQMDGSIEKPKSRSRRGAMMLAAARKIIGLFNSGNAGVSAALTYVRIMFQLGKTMQAVEMTKQLMETVNADGEISTELPFLPPLAEQDETSIKTDFSKWLTVRIVEAWISLRNPSTYMVGKQELGMLKALDGNPETLARFEKVTELKGFEGTNKIMNQNEIHKPNGTFVHLCFNHVFAKSLADLVEYTNRNTDHEHWLFIEKHRAIHSYSANTSGNPYATFFDFQSQLKEVLHECMKPKVDAVFMHGLFFDWQKNLIKAIAAQKHIGWVIWGGDLYNPIENNAPIHSLVDYVDSIHPVAQGDVEIFRDHYEEKDHYNFKYPIPGIYGQKFSKVEKQDPPLIIVGNSGDPSNNHIDILQILSKKDDIHNYRILLPVAYNLSSNYESKLISSVKELGLANNTSLHKDFISPYKYMELIESSHLLVTAHNRQQAIGNILASLCAGNPTFLKKKIINKGESMTNPTWDLLGQYGLKGNELNELREVRAIRDIEKLTKKQKQYHRKVIQEEYGLQKISAGLKRSCKSILRKGVSSHPEMIS